MEILTALFVASLLLPGGTSECRFCSITTHPEDITVMAGEPARFNCTMNLDVDLHAEWNCGGFVVSPWPVTDFKMGYEYPTDGDTSIGTYDLVIPKVSWKEHNNMQYRCQIRELRKGSDFAKLTVIVPPAIEMNPSRRLIEYDWTEKEARIPCFTNYATPGFRVEWTVDGKAVNNVTEKKDVMKHKRGGHLIQLISTIDLPLMKRWQPDSVSGNTSHNATGNGSASPRPRDYRAFLEKTYDAVLRVTCRVVSNDTAAKTKERSAWVVLKGESKIVAPAAQRGSGSNILHYLLTGGCAIVVLALAVSLLIWAWRRRTPPENPANEGDDNEYGFSKPFGNLPESEKDGEEMLSVCNSSRGVRLSQALSSPLTVSTGASDTEENPPGNQSPLERFRRFSRAYRDAGEPGHVTRPRPGSLALAPYQSLRRLAPMPSLQQSPVPHSRTLQRPGIYDGPPYQYAFLPLPAPGAPTLPPRRIVSFSGGGRPPVETRGREEAGSLV